MTQPPPTFLVTGGNGLLAHQLRQRLAADSCAACFLDHTAFDLTNPSQMAHRLSQIRPQVLINTAAYNAVDRCEVERDRSWAVNATGPAVLAGLCAERRVRLVHYSTDYVFDGTKQAPYVENDAPRPLNHYGAGKLAGEHAVLHASARNLVLRTSWLFGWHPTQRKTFVHTILAAAEAGKALRATTDQVSVPTCAADLAGWTVELLAHGAEGLFHAVNSDGVSRFEWTKAILEEAAGLALLPAAPPVMPARSSMFASDTRRPGYSVLSNAKLAATIGEAPGSWRPGLREMLALLKEHRLSSG